ncbi:MAG: lipoyl(octanoyl) transferase LipB [Actinomycetota bacterium]
MADTTDPDLRTLRAAWFGRVEYGPAWELQRRLFEERLEARIDDVLMLLEHPHTYTLGRRALEEDLVYDETERSRRGIALYRIDRGGRATYHGPGQLVGYPILALGERYDVLSYLRRLESALIATVAQYGVEARRDEGHTGVWAGPNKIAAIGVKITRGVTMHGFALNVTTDLSVFEGIVPCGLADRWVTSIEGEAGARPSVEEVADVAAKQVAGEFERDLVWGDTTEWSRRESLHG